VPVPYPVPVETPAAGSPESIRQTKPRYPRQDRLPPWRPAQRPPRPGNAERLAKFVDAMHQQENDIRAYMRGRH
jgi:hypothetical protein